MSGPADTRPTKSTFSLTCLACRLGCHDECCAVIVISGGKLHGTYKCACSYPHQRGNGILIVDVEQ